MTSSRRGRNFDSREFQLRYHTDAFLGAACSDERTVFSIWAPTAKSITLRLYEKGSGCGSCREYRMKPGPQGRWTRMVPENLDGMYYDYLVDTGRESRETADPCARACGVNGRRSMVVDLRRTDPEGWEEDVPPPAAPETIIYEVHVKDFSCSPSSGVKPEWRGKFLALTQEGTTLNGDGVHPTGLDWLKGLGITHVQLMPVYDYGSVDEAGSPDQFNWGYDPVNYNVPEGSYATDPFDGAVRIRELKQAVQSLHRSGLRVIMDVVYNHTFRLDSWLWRTVPWYYCRRQPDGKASNGSGCGNDLASERSMCARYILDSVLYWAEEYHMDGFRFDLMGLLDVPLMNRIRQELDHRYGRGEKVMLGEPWAAGPTAAAPGTVLASKGNLGQLDSLVAAFCDSTRDAVNGELWSGKKPGFASGAALEPEKLLNCLRAWCVEPGQRPSQVVTYLSCHDNLTLWDRLVNLGDPEKRYGRVSEKLLRQNRFAAAICFCCQGMLFLLSGEEFGRTKLGNGNSYNAPLEVNRLDWELAWRNRELADWYRGLMALRVQLPALCDKSMTAGSRLKLLPEQAENCVLVTADNRGGDSPWDLLLLAFSAAGKPVTVKLPEGDWETLVTAQSSFAWQNPETLRGTALLEPVSALVLGQRRKRAPVKQET